MNWLQHNYVWYSGLLCFILFISWFTSSPSFEPAIRLVASGSALFGHFIKNKSPKLSDLKGKKKAQLIALLQNDKQDSSTISKQILIERITNVRLQTYERQKKVKLYSLFAFVFISIVFGYNFIPAEEVTVEKNQLNQNISSSEDGRPMEDLLTVEQRKIVPYSFNPAAVDVPSDITYKVPTRVRADILFRLLNLKDVIVDEEEYYSRNKIEPTTYLVLGDVLEFTIHE